MRRVGWPCLAAFLALGAVTEAANFAQLSSTRIERLTVMLPELPCGVGRPIAERQAWDAIAKLPAVRSVVPAAEKMLKQALPELTDDLYLDFSQTGNRRRGEAVISRRHGRLPALVLAECLENRGRFLPGIEACLRAICAEKTWVLPAHDRKLVNFKGKAVEIDLNSAATSWNLATAGYWLGERLGPEVRQLVAGELRRRTFAPYLRAVREGRPWIGWLSTTNNWNAVCLAGVTGSALAAVPSRRERALFVAAAEKYVQNFIDGFTADGYCSEGVGYWNYGFGHFVLLAETIKQATGGQVDLMEGPKIVEMAMFGRRMEILPGIYPAFADCSPDARPDWRLMAFLSRRLQWGLRDVEERFLLLTPGPSGTLFEQGVDGFPNSASQTPAAPAPSAAPNLRDWFGEAGILICRPASGRSGMGAALKGGHNAEHHNHNDVGSFVVALGKGTPLLDPGAEVYTARTFSSQRYDSQVLNSFGHSVPRVAGRLQRTGRQAAAKILKTEFTDKADTLVMDIRSAYDVKSLRRLDRTFLFSREGHGSLEVIDEVEFDQPQEFGTALITFSKFRTLSPQRLLVGDGAEAVCVAIATDGPAFHIQPIEIKENLARKQMPVRLGIDLEAPVTKALIRLTITAAKEK